MGECSMTRSLQVLMICLVCLLAVAILIQSKTINNEGPIAGQASDNDTAGSTGPTISIAQEYTVNTLDPADATDTGSIRLIANIFEGLVRFKPGTAKIEPCLAQSWKISKDGLIYTFDLRRGVSFHDGTALDASAVQYSVQKQLAKQNDGPTTYADVVYGPLDKVKVIDQHTIEFHLKYPYAPFLNNLAMPMAAPVVSPAASRLNTGKFGAHPVGTGPFVYAGEKNGGLVLKANQDYWGTPPAAGEILF